MEKEKMDNDIDFVILWVDGNDSKWKEEKSHYEEKKSDDRECRYRDWDNLQYWFRGVEKYANWVHKIYFVTCGHLPKWLNTENPKLQVVNHKDFIPAKYLPTFSSHAIELNIHRIQGLSEQFVYFNDDMFITNNVNPSFFFKRGLPCASAALNVLSVVERESALNGGYIFMPHVYDMALINSNFMKSETIRSKPFNWLNPIYGIDMLRTLCLLPWPWFSWFLEYHLPYAWLKSTLQEIWDKEYRTLDETCSHKFRRGTDVNSWLVTYWQLAKNQFVPRSPKKGACMELLDDEMKNEIIYKNIKRKKYSLLCINDKLKNIENFEETKRRLKQSFETVLPEKCSFEI